MAIVSTHMNATPEQVFEVLSDGWLYGNWVVGTSHVRAVEKGWPATGTRLHHASGSWPLVTRDETAVEECVPSRMLALTARGRPFGQARVVIELIADDTGTTVQLRENPVAGPGKWLNNPATEVLLTRRNIEALARLTAIVERHTEP